MEWCKLRIMRRPFLPLGERFKSLTRRIEFAVLCRLSVPCSIYPIYAHGGSRGVHHANWGSGGWLMTIFTGVKPPVGNLNNHNSQGEGIICCFTSECPNLPCGEGATRMCEPSSNYDRGLRGRKDRKRGGRITVSRRVRQGEKCCCIICET